MVFRVQDNTKAQRRGQMTSLYMSIFWLTELCWFLQGHRISSSTGSIDVLILDLSIESICCAPFLPEKSERYLPHNRSQFWSVVEKTITKCCFLLYLFSLSQFQVFLSAFLIWWLFYKCYWNHLDNFLWEDFSRYLDICHRNLILWVIGVILNSFIDWESRIFSMFNI